jgi:hypothetical protein
VLAPSDFDLDAIRSVADDLSLTRDVTIALTGELTVKGLGPVNGLRRDREGGHLIKLDATRPAASVNRTLAHELYHCHQAERHGVWWRMSYAAERRAAPTSRENSFERTARYFARALVRRGVRLVA